MPGRAYRNRQETYPDMQPSDPVPSFVFDTADSPEQHRFEVWREQINPLFDIAPQRDDCLVNARTEGDFSARLSGFHLGPILFGRTTTQAQTYERTARRVARDGLDHFMVQGFLDGGGPRSDGSGWIAPGDLLVIDFAQPHRRPGRAMDTLSLIIPRDLDPALSQALAALHERCLPRDSAMVRLLFDLMQSTFRNVPAMTLREAHGVRDAVAGLLTSGLDLAGMAMDKTPEKEVALGFAVRQYLERHLDKPLDIPALLRQFPLSRSALYRLFESEGGVRRYVQMRRLRRAMHMLQNPARSHMPIADLAFACGFASDSHFYRSFREHYGYSPGDVRDRRVSLGTARGDDLKDWLGAI